ncbi:MAG: sugar phosphate isomerase/epimerase [Spirochaetales bacterium]|nr:sugar phosphate isomerase/epimerase [Spirochaetales bacterium]
MKAPTTKIAVTLYNLRDYCKTKEDLDNTLGKVKAIGYEAVQISGIGPIPPDEVRELLDKHELYCCATHENLDSYENDFAAVVKKLKILGCDFTALGHPGNAFWSPSGAKDLAARLEKAGKKFREEGITLAYHNHHIEFVSYSDSDSSKTFLEELYENTTGNLFAELDVHWIQRGGADPASWIRKMAGRTSVLHFKDFTMKKEEDNSPTPEFAEIGEGNLNWKEIVQACEDTNVRWYVVEQDTPRGERDIFESIKISFDNMKKMGVE